MNGDIQNFFNSAFDIFMNCYVTGVKGTCVLFIQKHGDRHANVF